MRLRILADDLTGALDSAAAFASGDVPVWLGAARTHHGSQAAVQALSTGTRDLARTAAEQAVLDVLAWFRPNGGEPCMAFKKIDSLLRGNTLVEVAALARSGAFTTVVFAPAFPAQGRFTQGGRHWVGVPHRPESPAVQVCAEALAHAFAKHGLDAISGPAAMPKAGQASQIWIPDVLADSDLLTLATASRRADAGRWLWCGSAGLASAFAQACQTEFIGLDHAPADLPAPPTLAVTASRHPVLREQMRLVPSGCHDQASARNGVAVLDLAPSEDLAPEQAARHLAASCSKLMQHRTPPPTAVVIGGDTLLALCKASGATHLLAHKSIRPGWGRARIEGGLWHGTTLLSRSGAFGAPDDIAALLGQLAPHTSKESIT